MVYTGFRAQGLGFRVYGLRLRVVYQPGGARKVHWRRRRLVIGIHNGDPEEKSQKKTHVTSHQGLYIPNSGLGSSLYGFGLTGASKGWSSDWLATRNNHTPLQITSNLLLDAGVQRLDPGKPKFSRHEWQLEMVRCHRQNSRSARTILMLKTWHCLGFAGAALC